MRKIKCAKIIERLLGPIHLHEFLDNSAFKMLEFGEFEKLFITF